MPKYLFLCRHAETSPAVANQSDFDRQLTSSGIVDAQKAAAWIRDLNHPVTAVYSSTARRTTATARLIADELKVSMVQEEDSLYNASEKVLEDFINSLPAQEASVVLVGHNPSVSELVGKLNLRPNQYVPTAGVNFFTFQTDDWQEITWSEVTWKPSY